MPGALALLFAAAQTAPLIAVRDADPDAVSAETRAAFVAVFGRGHPVRRTWHGAGYAFEPVTSVALGGGRIALVSTGENDDAGHASPGLNAVHYLVRRGGRLRVVGRWFGIGTDGSMGRATSRWGVTRALSRWPILYTEGGGTWQGCTVTFATLTELRPAGAVDVAEFPVSYADGNTGWPNAGQEVEGEVTRAVRDASFTVRYTGTTRLSETYVRAGNRYRLRGGGESRAPGC